MAVVGIIGCGNIADVHARMLVERDGVELALCDRNIERAQRLGLRHDSTKVYSDLADMLAMENLRALHVLTRVDSHSAIAHTALDAGVHVYVEKPVTETRAEFDELRKKAEGAGLTFYPGFSSRGLPAVGQVTDIVRSREFGRLISVHCDWNWTTPDSTIPYGSADHWAYSLRGGILQNLADHPASIVAHLLDGIERASWLRRRHRDLPNGVHDLLHVAAANDDQLGSFTMSFGHHNAHGGLVCNFEGATVTADLRTHVTTVTALRGLPGLRRRVLSGVRASAMASARLIGVAGRRALRLMPSAPDLHATIANFHDVIDRQATPLVDLDRAAEVIEVLDAVWSSSDDGDAEI